MGVITPLSFELLTRSGENLPRSGCRVGEKGLWWGEMGEKGTGMQPNPISPLQ